MAHYYMSAKGNRKERTCCGTKGSGISAHVRGWNIGARVEISHVDGKDVVRVIRTGGSNGGTGDVLAEYSE